jgi:hypothetical protein
LKRKGSGLWRPRSQEDDFAMTSLREAAPRRKNVAPVDQLGPSIPTISSGPVVVPDQLSVGGRLVHRLTRRCPAFCNQVAQLAGIGIEQGVR